MTPCRLTEPVGRDSSLGANERAGKVRTGQLDEEAHTALHCRIGDGNWFIFIPTTELGILWKINTERSLKITQSPVVHKKFTHFCPVQFVQVQSKAKSHKFRAQILTMSKLLHICNDINFLF